MYRKFILVIRAPLAGILLLSFASFSYSQSGIHPDRKDYAVFKLKITGKPSDSYKFSVFFCRDFISDFVGAEDSYTNNIRLYSQPDKNGELFLRVDSITHIGKFYIAIRRDSSYLGVGNFYFVEPGDSVTINIQDNDTRYSASFSGPGAEKYTCSYSINEFSNRNARYIRRKGVGESYASYLARNIIETQQFVDNCSSILKQYKQTISQNVYFLIKTEIFSFPFECRLFDLRSYYTGLISDSANANQIKAVFQKWSLSVDTTNSVLLALSEPWTRFAVGEIFTELAFRYGRLPNYAEAFHEIRTRYSGFLQEKLFGALLLNPDVVNKIRSQDLERDNDEIMACLDTAYNLAKTKYLKEYFRAQSVFTKGHEAFDFSLKDTAGGTVKLSDFRGKVVILDTWFTGCTGCAQFYQKFEDSIYPVIKNDPSFVLVSICSDSSKTTWIKSIDKKIYTNDHHVNLTLGSDSEHSEFTLYYAINTYPLVLVIDRKGKMFRRLRNLSDAQAIIKTLYQAKG